MKKYFKVSIIIILVLVVTVVVLELTSSYTPSASINLNAPVKTAQEIKIYAPVEKVYALFSQVNEWPTWQEEITAAKLNGAFIPGSTIDWKTGGLTIRSTLYTVERNKVIGWSGTAFGSFAIHVWRFEQQGEYTTVKVSESMEGWLVSTLSSYFQKHLEPATKNWLTALKKKAEFK